MHFFVGARKTARLSCCSFALSFWNLLRSAENFGSTSQQKEAGKKGFGNALIFFLCA